MTPVDPTEPGLLETAEVTTAVVADVVPTAELPAFFDGSFSRLVEVLGAQEIGIAGPAFARYHGPPGEIASLEVGFATDRAVDATEAVRPGTLPGGRVARVLHRGGYDQLGESWAQLQAWIESQGLTATDCLWEVYLTEPTPDMDPGDLRTELNWQVSDAAR